MPDANLAIHENRLPQLTTHTGLLLRAPKPPRVKPGRRAPAPPDASLSFKGGILGLTKPHASEKRTKHRLGRPPSGSPREIPNSTLKLNHDVDVDELLISAQIGEPHGAALCSAGSCRCGFGQLHGRISVVASKELGITIVGIRHSSRTRRCYSAATRPIRNTRVAVVVLPAESEPLPGHVVKRQRRIPGLEWVPGIPRKVR